MQVLKQLLVAALTTRHTSDFRCMGLNEQEEQEIRAVDNAEIALFSGATGSSELVQAGLLPACLDEGYRSPNARLQRQQRRDPLVNSSLPLDGSES